MIDICKNKGGNFMKTLKFDLRTGMGGQSMLEIEIGFKLKDKAEFESFEKGEDAKIKKWKELSKLKSIETSKNNLKEEYPRLGICFPLEFGKIEDLAKTINAILRFEKLEVSDYKLPSASGDKKDLLNSLKIALKK